MSAVSYPFNQTTSLFGQTFSFDWVGKSYKAALCGITLLAPIKEQTNWSQIQFSEITSAGYTAGGVLLQNKQFTVNGSIASFFANPVSWSNITSIIKYLVIYEVSSGTLISYVMLDYYSSYADLRKTSLVVDWQGQPLFSLLYESDLDSTGPGPTWKQMLASNQYDSETDTGFFGEVSASELWNTSELSSMCSFSAGTVNVENLTWLKFYVGKTADCNIRMDPYILYVAKQGARINVTWADLVSRGLIDGWYVYNRTLRESPLYRCRLINGAYPWIGPTNIYGMIDHSYEFPDVYPFECLTDIGRKTEWNDLIYRLVNENIDCSTAPLDYHGGTKVFTLDKNWSTLYSRSDLGLGTELQPTPTWGMENNPVGGLLRGAWHPHYLNTATSVSSAIWRPCLEMQLQSRYDENVRLHNDERQAVDPNRQRLRRSVRLDCIAQRHADWMVGPGGQFSHTGEYSRDYSWRALRDGYPFSVGENLLAGLAETTMADAINGWIGSPGHYANMINPDFREVGLGVSTGRQTKMVPTDFSGETTEFEMWPGDLFYCTVFGK